MSLDFDTFFKKANSYKNKDVMFVLFCLRKYERAYLDGKRLRLKKNNVRKKIGDYLGIKYLPRVSKLSQTARELNKSIDNNL